MADRREDEKRGPHYSLAGLHDLDDLTVLEHRHGKHHRPKEDEPRQGTSPEAEKVDPLDAGTAPSPTQKGE